MNKAREILKKVKANDELIVMGTCLIGMTLTGLAGVVFNLPL